jgi:hypothetical protein
MSLEPQVPVPPPLFELNLDDRGVHLAPRTWEELEQWLEVERQFWLWLSESGTQDANLPNIFNNHIQYHSNKIRTAIAAAKGSPPNDGFGADIKNYLTQRFVNQRALHSSTVEAEYVARLSKKDPQIAAYALWVLMGQGDKISDNIPANNGYVAGYLFRLGVNQEPTEYSDTWKKLHKSVASDHDKLRAENARISAQYASQLAAAKTAQQEQKEDHGNDMKDRAVEWKAALEKHSTEMEGIRKAFREETALKAAVDYFDTKAEEQSDLAGKARRWGLGIAFVAVALTLGIGFSVLSKRVDADHTTLAVSGVFAFLIFWLLRIVVRIFLSAAHLATDMSSRATFVQTYLALIAEGGAIADKQRDQVIGLVFRPISDGLVRDDATPPTWMNLFTRT